MASRHGEGRVVSLLEGGYNLDNLGRTVHDQHRLLHLRRRPNRPARLVAGAGAARYQTVPDAPINLMAEATDGAVTLTWAAPEDDGGSAVTDYQYRINRRNPWISIGSTDTTHTVTSLVNGTEYVFEVRAVRAEATPGVGALDRQRGGHHLRSGVRERGHPSDPSRPLLLRPGGLSH